MSIEAYFEQMQHLLSVSDARLLVVADRLVDAHLVHAVLQHLVHLGHAALEVQRDLLAGGLAPQLAAQILLGLAAGLNEFGAYEDATRRAADWLVRTQDDDGCWRGYPSPFASPGVKVYETHVAWGLFEAERALPGRGYLEAGLKQVRWALGFQRDNGWFAECCLSDSQRPLTHTLGYALRGVLEAHRSTGDDVFLQAGRLCADGMLSVLGQDGRLPGCLDADWQPAASWVCLTGAVQTAYCWLYLFENTGDFSYLSAARRANHFVRRTVEMQGPEGVAGGVKGSFPVDGEYGRFEYLSWAVKFAIDSWHYENRLAGTND